LGANPQNLHILGKTYSSSSTVIEKLIAKGCHYYPNQKQSQVGQFANTFKQDIKNMWRSIQVELTRKQPDMIVILDDGGACLAQIPNEILSLCKVVGVEQTSSGRRNILSNKINFPTIDVASTAAKQLVESHMIAATVTEKISHVLPKSGQGYSCFVVGLGVIGQAVTKKLLSLGYHVSTFDNNPLKNCLINNANKVQSFAEGFEKADYIFGCTGEDITVNLDLNKITSNKIFVSCSSQDKEFLTLLHYIAVLGGKYNNILEDINFTNINGINIKVCRGGFPVNFDQTAESVIGRDIQLTRGLLLGGMLQAIVLANKHQLQNRVYMLSPMLQQIAIHHWKQNGSVHLIDPALLALFDDIEWIKQNSGGFYISCDSFIMPSTIIS